MTELELAIDKSTWGPGPWQDEPDRIEWRHSSGLPCLIVRSDITGALCGYVGCPPGHPFHGRARVDIDVHVHGGLTYSAECDGHICHAPLPGETDSVYWIGFDCAHGYDDLPGIAGTLRSIGAPPLPGLFGHYRDLAYVTSEVERLAEQVHTAGLDHAGT